MFQGNMGGFSGPSQHSYPAQPYEAPQPMQGYPYYAQDQMLQRIQGMQPYINQAQMYGYNPMQMYAAYNPYVQQSPYLYPYQQQVPYTPPITPQSVTPTQTPPVAPTQAPLPKKVPSAPVPQASVKPSVQAPPTPKQNIQPAPKKNVETQGLAKEQAEELKDEMLTVIQEDLSKKGITLSPEEQTQLEKLFDRVAKTVEPSLEGKLEQAFALLEKDRPAAIQKIQETMKTWLKEYLQRIVQGIESEVKKPEFAAIRAKLTEIEFLDNNGKVVDVEKELVDDIGNNLFDEA